MLAGQGRVKMESLAPTRGNIFKFLVEKLISEINLRFTLLLLVSQQRATLLSFHVKQHFSKVI